VIAVGETPKSVAVDEGAVWVLNSDEETLSRVDPARRVVVRTIGSGPQPTGLATGAGSVWVSAAGHVLRRFDPDSGLAAAAPIPRAAGAPPTDPSASWVASDGTAVWAVNDDTVTRVRPGPPVRTVPSLVTCCGPLVLGAASVWTTDATGLVRIDARTGSRRAHIALPFLDNGFGTPNLAVGFGSVWILDQDGSTVWRVDTATNRVVGTITVGTHPTGVAIGAGAVWVASADGTVARIDPAGAQGVGQVVRSVRVGGTPSAIAVGDDAVWVAVD
jgi:YVTN family beta-propeller protein